MASKKFYSGKHANMPTELVMKPFPTDGSIMPEGIDDKLSGVDHQINRDKAGIKRQMKPLNK